ncbi:MAG: TlpA disulfide reductase family protein [Bacteroidota bacterium]
MIKQIPLLLTTALAGLLIPWGTPRAQSTSAARLKLEELDGKRSAISDYLEKGPVYLSFWALWCEPCKQELRALKKFVRENTGRGFTVIAVNQDSPRSLAKVKAYVRSQDYPFPVVLDPNGQLLQAFNGQNLPFSVLLDTTGRVVGTRTGYLAGDEAEIGADILRRAR